MDLDNDDFCFLPFFLDEDIYLIESAFAVPTATEVTIVSHKPDLITKPVAAVILPNLASEAPIAGEIKSRVAIEVVETQTIQVISKKVIIMVGYQSVASVPALVHEALSKIFTALSIELNEVEIVNVLAANAPKIEHYSFQYLILMGGNGKNLSFMQNYLGSRNRYDIAKHAGKSIFFAESMDIYLKDQELKKKFWMKLKLLFGR